MIFDWGGTLTRWHDVDFHGESVALAAAVTTIGHDADAARVALHEAGRSVWGRSRDHQQSATVADLFDEAGLEHDPGPAHGVPGLLGAAHLHRPRGAPDVRATAGRRAQDRRPVQHDLAACLACRVLRARRRLRPHRRRRLHQRDSVDEAVAARVRGGDGGRRRDRARPLRLRRRPALYDDIWGAQQAGMRAVHIPLSDIPAEQAGTREGSPDGVVHTLAALPDLLATW